MRHRKKGRKFGRRRNARKAFLISLSKNLIKNEKITTTETRAKEVRPFVEKIVTKAKNDTLHSRRLVVSKIGKVLTKKLFEVMGPRYKSRNGGYTRITKIPSKRADAAKTAIIEFVK